MRENFLKYLRYEKRYSQHTITSYAHDLNQFEDFIQTSTPNADLINAGHDTIRSWVVNLMDQKMEGRSVNRKIACLRSYYKFLLKKGAINKDPTRKIRLLQSSKKLPHFVHENEMIQLLDKVIFNNDFNGCRDQLILEVLYGTGIRLSELLGLKTDDINFSNRTIKVLGKRNKERLIPFNANLVQTIRRYLMQRNNIGPVQDESRLLVTDKGKSCYPMIIYRTVKKYLNLITTIEKRSPHVLRHTFATHLLNKGAELNAVKDLLGHTSLAATQVYTHNSLDKLKSVFDQAHPKA